jgi:hypothetical protein
MESACRTRPKDDDGPRRERGPGRRNVDNGRAAHRPRTAADLVIETMAASEAALIDGARELAADVHAYREIAQVLLGEVARLRQLVPPEQAT